MGRHLRRLFEIFMPEARFPDEKFWTKDGDAIQAAPKGAPAGAVGTTHKDYGSYKDPRRATDTHKPQKFDWAATGKALRDIFSTDPETFKRNIEGAAAKLFGPRWKDLIDRAWGSKGFTDGVIKKMWDKNYTDNEGIGDIGFLFDTAQRPGEVQGYRGSYRGADWEPEDKGDFVDNGDDWESVPRTGRPTGVGPDGNLTF
jgi:hypothetical protein